MTSDKEVAGVDSLTVGETRRARVGVVATDPLRVLGLQTMFRGEGDPEMVPLSVPGVLGEADLAIVLIDAGCTEHLLELVKTFGRVRPLVRVIVIGDLKEPEYIKTVIGAGAKGYLTQTATENEIRMALEIVGDGSIWAPRKILSRLLDETRGQAKVAVQFTHREVEILKLLTSGLGNREIAEDLVIDVSTVKAHLTRLMRKVGVSNRVELTVAALRKDFSEPDES